ncbi:MAG: ABC transporter permease [Bacteroidetes bacterium]|nr:ABC transporter permease [Bacteroidota bacterium]
MNTTWYIAKRIAFNKQKTFSRFIIRLSVAATAISVAAMIITICFVNGFQKAVSEKVFNFWGNIRVQHLALDKSLIAEESVIERNDTVENTLKNNSAIAYFQPFATKSAVLKKGQEIEGVLLKGIDKTYDSLQLKKFIVKGRWLHFNDSSYSKEIILSEAIANELNLNLNDTATLFFISPNNQSTYRKVLIAAIYKTGIEEYDKLFAITDLKLLQRVSNLNANKIGGYEIMLKHNNNGEDTTVSKQLNAMLPTVWGSRSIREVYPNIFDWLEILNNNRAIIFIVMSIVAIINLITCLLILVLERTRMIGILKSVGITDNALQKLFLYYAGLIALKGTSIGVLIGLGICILQQTTGIITLNEANYYIAYAPVQIIWWQVGSIVLATIIVCITALILPALIVTTIKPVKAIQFR